MNSRENSEKETPMRSAIPKKLVQSIPEELGRKNTGVETIISVLT